MVIIKKEKSQIREGGECHHIFLSEPTQKDSPLSAHRYLNTLKSLGYNFFLLIESIFICCFRGFLFSFRKYLSYLVYLCVCTHV